MRLNISGRRSLILCAKYRTWIKSKNNSTIYSKVYSLNEFYYHSNYHLF